MNADNYLSSAIRMVLADRSWWWRAAVIAAVGTVPYVGSFLIAGYFMVIMGDAAWSSDRGLPWFSERSTILRRSWDGFVVGVVWGLLLAVPLAIFTVAVVFVRAAHGSGPAIPWWYLTTLSLMSGALSVFLSVALLRASIYLRPSAGLTIRGVRELISRYPAGFRKVTGIMLAVFAISAVLSAPATYARYFVTLSPFASNALLYGGGFLVALVTAPLRFVMFTAYGLWAKDTDPSSWPPLTGAVAGDSHHVATAQVATAPLNDAYEPFDARDE